MCVCMHTDVLGLVEVFAAIVLSELLVGCCVKMEDGPINGPDDDKLFIVS